jgi:NADH:quinone reductase (non-electrogenic)
VVMGSRFLNTIECRVHEDIKKAMIAAEMTDTMIIQRSIGSPVRVLKNDWAFTIAKMEAEGATLEQLLPKLSGQLSGEAWVTGGADAVFPCGQVIGRIRETLTVQALVDKIMDEAEAVRKRLAALG